LHGCTEIRDAATFIPLEYFAGAVSFKRVHCRNHGHSVALTRVLDRSRRFGHVHGFGVRFWVLLQNVSGLLGRVLAGIAMGLTAVSIISTPWGQRSGAHMNPALTLTFLSLGKIAPWDALFYTMPSLPAVWREFSCQRWPWAPPWRASNL
jgi:hypothetical protein